MTPIISRTTNERIIRLSIMAAILVGYTPMWFYDGLYRYPQANLSQALENLPRGRPANRPAINLHVKRAAVESLAPGATLDDVVQRFGQPSWQAPADDGSEDVRYFGPGGTMQLSVVNNRLVRKPEWLPGGKTETDQTIQLGIGIMLAAIAIPFLIFYFVRVLGFRCELSEAGLKHPGHPLIPFEAMQSLSYVKSGLFDLAYAPDGATRAIRLDNYKIKAFNEIVGEICQQRGFAWPQRQETPETSKASARPPGRDDA